jgi:DNA-binding LytR/AlgR family response regulator
MSDEMMDALIALIDAKIEYAIASREEDEGGYTTTPLAERNAAERAEREFRKFASWPR